MSPALPEGALRALGRTEGDAHTLGLLVRDQDTRRFVLLRALLDAAAQAPDPVCPPELRHRVATDWALLEAADGADRAAARSVLLYPLVGPWALRCLRGLTGAAPGPELRADLAHFGALAVAAAIRAGLSFTTRIVSPGPVLSFPTVGALDVRPGEVGVSADATEVTLRQTGPAEVVVQLDAGAARSWDPRWRSTRTLPPLLSGAAPVPMDDLDPYRTAGPGPHGLGAAVRVEGPERTGWAQAWAGTAAELRTGGHQRLAEAAVLLRCLVPLAPPPGSGPSGTSAAHCSGTRREAFGAVLSSRPATSAHFASTLVHELQHTKIAALSAMAPLHHEGPDARYFAPWRPDPRPFDGLLQGAVSHAALADFWQQCALGAERTDQRDLAWSEHARRREQVGAVLPVLAGSGALTPEGRVIVNELITLYHRLAESPAPTGHQARARAYVRTARVIWQQRNDAKRR
ncbi:HEXXH motif domain-containing protein [Streptomyces finlayi]|uniref:HEXXH motif domain-containing protein n=1 Tax=Streptomyces finlayi TaxID=67296 RepID=A0A7G7BI15_9ACTN|nr:HEXXH motif-containing putative peptide modification protein [Streptomyces finlayi]QNE74980.1 HEXXH motif domain-containing protein [Streptomyces finlayi]